jgi:hypothetical protein
MNENITNSLFALPSYFSGLALLVGHREENTNYKKKLIKIASQSGPTMNISYRPRWMAIFGSLITTGLAKNRIQFAAQNRPNINSHENEKLSKAQIF